MFVTTQGYVSEFQLHDYLQYANKQKEISIVNIGVKKLYEMYLENFAKSNRQTLVTNHKSTTDVLLASFGQERLVEVNGRQCRRLVFDVNEVNYTELQDHLVGDFVFMYKGELVIVDNVSYDEENPNEMSSTFINKKLMKLKRRCYLYKSLAALVAGKGSRYISIVWNSETNDDLLDFIDTSYESNKHLRKQYCRAKKNNELNRIAGILTRIHVKTNINLNKLTFDVTKGIY